MNDIITVVHWQLNLLSILVLGHWPRCNIANTLSHVLRSIQILRSILALKLGCTLLRDVANVRTVAVDAGTG